jgi:hypothetical protein
MIGEEGTKCRAAIRGARGSSARRHRRSNRRDKCRAGLQEGQTVSLASDAEAGLCRDVSSVTPFSPPDGCLGAYSPAMAPAIDPQGGF